MDTEVAFGGESVERWIPEIRVNCFGMNAKYFFSICHRVLPRWQRVAGFSGLVVYEQDDPDPFSSEVRLGSTFPGRVTTK
jgi:hypothetical protein